MSVRVESVGRVNESERCISISNSEGDARTFQVLTDELLKILAWAHRQMQTKRNELLKKREKRQREFDQGKWPNNIRECLWRDHKDWTVGPIPSPLRSRKVELILPASDTNSIIHAINYSQSKSISCNFIIDYEETIRPNWSNILNGPQNTKGALLGDLLHFSSETDISNSFSFVKKSHTNGSSLSQLKSPLLLFKRAGNSNNLMIRIRGLERHEPTIQIDGEKICAGIFDLVTHIYYIGPILSNSDHSLAIYLPKCDHHLEARWWQQLLSQLESHLGLKENSIKVTIQLDTIMSLYQAEEILYELRSRAVGIYLYPLGTLANYLKNFRNDKKKVLCNLSSLEKQERWHQHLYARLLSISKERQVPFLIANNNFLLQNRLKGPEKIVIEKQVQEELENSYQKGISGVVLFHTHFLELAAKIFNSTSSTPKNDNHYLSNYKKNLLDPSSSNAKDDALCFQTLFPENTGPKTLRELRYYIRQGIRFIERLEHGHGCLYGQYGTETLLTFEVTRWLAWNWSYHKIALDDWGVISKNFIKKIFEEELETILLEEGLIGSLNSHRTLKWVTAKNKTKELFLEDLLTDIIHLIERDRF